MHLDALLLQVGEGGIDIVESDREVVRTQRLGVGLHQVGPASRWLGLETLIGFDGLDSVDVAGTAKRRAFVADCMRRIKAEHRRWACTHPDKHCA